MKSRLFAAAAVASTAALTLAMVPATATSSTITDTDTFSSTTGLSDDGPVAADPTQQPTARSEAAPEAPAAPSFDLTRFYVRGYQTIYAKEGLSYSLGDVAVTGDTAFCRIESDMNVNDKVRAEPAISVLGSYKPNDPNESGRVGIIAKYGAAKYRFGPHQFFGEGADGECGTADDEMIGEPDPTFSNTLRIRYSTKGWVQYKKSGSKVTVQIRALRFDRTARFVALGSVRLQYRKAGTTTWKTKKALSLDTTGLGVYNFTSSAKYYYRAYIPLTDNVQSSYSSSFYL